MDAARAGTENQRDKYLGLYFQMKRERSLQSNQKSRWGRILDNVVISGRYKAVFILLFRDGRVAGMAECRRGFLEPLTTRALGVSV